MFRKIESKKIVLKKYWFGNISLSIFFSAFPKAQKYHMKPFEVMKGIPVLNMIEEKLTKIDLFLLPCKIIEWMLIFLTASYVESQPK